MNGYLATLLRRLGLSPLRSSLVAGGGIDALRSPPPGADEAPNVWSNASLQGQQALRRQPAQRFADLQAYLCARGNSDGEIARCLQLLGKPQLILEIGCGNGQIARSIALRNPDAGVLATDIYADSAGPASHYGRVARDWEMGRLEAQQMPLPNLVLVRAEGDVLDRLPDQCIDSALLIHPEPKVAAEFFAGIRRRGLGSRFRPGGKSLIVKPFSREMGMMTCGGFEFDHAEDWSRGLGFLIESPFVFQSDRPVQWGVDLGRASRYSKNSTQDGVFVCSDLSIQTFDCRSKARLVKKSNLV